VRSSLIVLGVALMLGAGLRASAADGNATEVDVINARGHAIGETMADFLRLEPEIGQKAEVCRQRVDVHPVHPAHAAEAPGEDADKRTDGLDCADLLAALDGEQRLEITNASSMEFVLSDGKLVRLTMRLEGRVEDEAADAAANLAKQFGTPSRETSISGQDNMGAKWKSCLVVWEMADASVTLYEDGDPSLQDRRPLLILESRANEYTKYTISVQQLATLSAGARPSTHPKRSLAR
jgi:hypothetical protein